MVGRNIRALLREALQDPVSHQSEALASATRAGRPALVLSIAFCFLSLSLIARNLLFPHPFVLGDEYYYSSLSRYFGHNTELFTHDPYIPHYPDELYFWLFSIVHLWGNESYAAVKVLNSVLLAAAMVPIYATARLFLERRTALFLSIVSVFAPINSLTAYFMPESCYLLMFWLFAFFFLCNLPRHTIKAGAYGGALLGLLVLIKPHALAILAAAELTIAAMMLLDEEFEISRLDGLLYLISLNAGFIVTLLIVHVGLFGHRDLNIFGFYTQFAGRMDKPVSFLSKALMVLIAHVVYTNIIFGLPLVVTLLGALGLFSSNKPECRARLRVLCVFAIFALIFLLAMTAKATVNFSMGLGPSELRRLHGRYYDFILPMFLIAFFALADPASARGGQRMLTLALFVCLVSVILGFVFIAPRTLVYSADYPEVAWLSNPFPAVGHIFWIVAALVLVYYLIVGFRRKAAYSKYLVLSLLTGSVLVSLSLYRSAGALPADRAGALVQSLFEGSERDTGIVAGSNLWMIFRCLFQIDGNPSVLLLPRGTPIGRTQVGNGRRWLLSL